jgi:hypothetical protein
VINSLVAAGIMVPEIWGPVAFVFGVIALAGILKYVTSNV